MWERWVEHDEPHIKESVMIVALSTGLPQYFMLYSQARELAAFILENVENKKIATYYNSVMEEFANVGDDAIATLPTYEVYQLFPQRTSKRNDAILMLTGYASPRNDVYEFCDRVLTKAVSKWGVKTLVSIGARWADEPTEPVLDSSRVYAFGASKTESQIIRRLDLAEHPAEMAPYFANVIASMAPLYGLMGFNLSVDHGEPRPHPRQKQALIRALCKLLEFNVDTSSLDLEAEKLKADVRFLNQAKGSRRQGPEDSGSSS
ncbi:MAG: PAC2 family protein [Thermoprotei archaeon]